MATRQNSIGAIRLVVRGAVRSFWFVPLILGTAGLLLAVGTLYLERQPWTAALAGAMPWLILEAESARAVLTTIAAATISATSIVYSLSLLILTLATGTLGPRLVESFGNSRSSRLTLGLQLAVFLYCITVLYSVGMIVERKTLSVALAIVMAVIALGSLVFFVHSIARSVNVDTTIARIAGNLRRRIVSVADEERAEAALPDVFRDGKGEAIHALGAGYVQAIDRDRLLAIAEAQEAIIALDVRSGAFVVRGAPIARIAVQGEVDGDARKRIADCVILGPQRTDVDDLRFSFQLLVEVALRALSPGVNDVFTAVACIDHLAAAFGDLAGRDLTPAVRSSADGTARVFSRELTFEDVADGVFHAIRQSGAGLIVMAIAMLRRLADLVEVIDDHGARACLLQHARLIASDARTSAAAVDQKVIDSLLQRIEERSAAA